MSWIDDNRGQGPWAFVKQRPKSGYRNNPLWTSEGTKTHDPCGYWYNNNTLYGTEAITGITQGTVWEEVAPSLLLPGEVSKLASIAVLDGILYCLYGADLYTWNGVDDWNLLLAGGSTADWAYESDMIAHDGMLYRIAMNVDDTRNLYRITPGASSWSFIRQFAYTTYARYLGVHDNEVYVTSELYGRLYRINGSLIASTDTRNHGLVIINGADKFLLGTSGPFSIQPLYEYKVGQPLINHGYAWSGCMTTDARSWAYCSGKVYYHASTSFENPYRTFSWCSEDGWVEIAPLSSNSSGRLVSCGNQLYGVLINNSLYVYNAELDFWQRLTGN